MQAAIISLAIFLLGGCAPAPKGPPTFAEQLERERKALAAISAKWAQGQKLVEQGEATVKAGEQLIAQGQQKRAQGKEIIERGKRMMEEAEQEYQMRTGATTFPLEEIEK